MEQFWGFVGSFWWLVFPLMGAAGGAARAWERSAKRRHERRLEILRIKGELKGASRPQPPAAVESGPTALDRLLATHDDVTRRWLDYELDVAKLIAFPAMSDGRQPLTAAFLRAKRVADGLRPASPKARLSPEELAEYRNAVADFEVAFDVAERDARRVRDSGFTETERKRLDTAKRLLTVAVDQAATPAERHLAYTRVKDELDGLIALSDEAIEVLETKVALELPSRPDARNSTDPAREAPGKRSPGPAAPESVEF